MNHQSTITVKQSESPMEVRQTYNTALSPIHDIFPDESKGKHQLARNCSTACPSLHVQTESLCSPSLQRASSFRSQKSSSTPEPDSPVSYSSHRQYPKTTFSRSSTFCTSLYSFSTGTETHRQLHSLPFLPHPPKCNQTIPVIHSSESPLPLIGDLSNQFAEKSPGYLTKECLNFAEDDMDGTFNGATYGSNSLTLTEQLELQYLSQELDIAITDNTENPRIDEIYEAHQVSSVPTDASKCNQNHLPPLVPPVDGQSHSCQPSPVTEASHKPRMRWTPELHECFLEAVKKLDGAEKATPKGILKLMNVDGLTIYHVKSHLQKYRLAKYVPETREDKEISNSEEKEKKATSDINEGDAQPKRGMQVTETLRMQMEVQKQLHEQLEVQRALQLRIEEHARYLQKILAEQEKASSSFVSTSSTSLLTESQAASELGPLPILADSFSEQATSEASSSKQEGIECTKVEQLAGQKRPRHEAKLEPGMSRLESPEQ